MYSGLYINNFMLQLHPDVALLRRLEERLLLQLGQKPTDGLIVPKKQAHPWINGKVKINCRPYPSTIQVSLCDPPGNSSRRFISLPHLVYKARIMRGGTKLSARPEINKKGTEHLPILLME